MSDVKPKKNSIAFVLQFVALGVILIGFPAGSWYYLQKGMDQRRAIMDELKDLGSLKAYTMSVPDADSWSFEDLQGKVKIVSFLDAESSLQGQLAGQTLQQLHDQFDNRDDIVFLLHFGDVSNAQMKRFVEQFEIDDPDQCLLLNMEGNAFQSVLTENYLMPYDDYRNQDGEVILLVDTQNEIRRYYDLKSEVEKKLLVEHIAFLMPRQQEKDLIFKREKEK